LTSPAQGRGDSDTTAPPAGTKTVLELETGIGCAIETVHGSDDKLRSVVQWQALFCKDLLSYRILSDFIFLIFNEQLFYYSASA